MASQITSPTIVYSSIYLDADKKKYQSSASLAFMRGIHRRPVNSPHKGPVTWKMFPFYDVIILIKYEAMLVLWMWDVRNKCMQTPWRKRQSKECFIFSDVSTYYNYLQAFDTLILQFTAIVERNKHGLLRGVVSDIRSLLRRECACFVMQN